MSGRCSGYPRGSICFKYNGYAKEKCKEWLCCYLNMVEDEYEVIEEEFTKLNTEMHRTGKINRKTEFRRRFEDEYA